MISYVLSLLIVLIGLNVVDIVTTTYGAIRPELRITEGNGTLLWLGEKFHVSFLAPFYVLKAAFIAFCILDYFYVPTDLLIFFFAMMIVIFGIVAANNIANIVRARAIEGVRSLS